MITVICHHSVIVGSMAWINRRNALSYYFVGNDVNYAGCSCGLTNTCSKSEKKCNCDINDKTSNKDTGEVTNKHDLPVLGMAVGDTGKTCLF
ncbi:hypothetical protein LOTGIDRAFT_133382 [Lottia gigantea]|uniref:Uncharacterized protein n=1 Tax=Lottia gigantea TaxID=225164 RepID=V3ZLX2_LOTGI|nr:hypothetical protein LOTGIDRAFT_133382 [Lottia gigantea]ESO83410.1 hypothetical protein LOTGIDRAFT_133382 [Lottia gigantea]